ncbi:MAG: Holliday junction resolvase RuvX [Clostridia bacterium]|nr:Holliday junction resolvase RuvX [Clostridia bacterium]
MRILCLDIGDKYIGVAVSDALGITAQGVGTLKRRDNIDEDILEIIKMVQKFNAEKIVVGLPKNMNGSLGPQGKKVLEFIDNLKEKIDIPVIKWDERLSTKSAEKTLLEGNVSRKKRKKVIDKVAAVFILQNYLDFLRS